MSDQEIVEVDISDLSEEVVDEMDEKGAIESSERSQFEDSVYLKELDISADAESISVVGRIIGYFREVKEELTENISKTNYGEIKNVKPIKGNEDGVVLFIEFDGKMFEYSLTEDDQRLANLAAYFSITNDFNQLKGELLPRIPEEKRTNTSRGFYIPHNTSLMDSTNFKLFGALKNAGKKAPHCDGKLDAIGASCMLALAICLFVRVFNQNNDILLFSIVIFALTLVFLWAATFGWNFLGVLAKLFKSDKLYKL